MRARFLSNPDSGGGTDADGVAGALRGRGVEIVEDDTAAERVILCGGDGTVGAGAGHRLIARLEHPSRERFDSQP